MSINAQLIPGGQVELQESIRDAAVREVREESGVLVELLAFRGIFQNVPKGICSFLFTGKQVGGALAQSDESTRVGWFVVPTALELVRRPAMRERIELALSPTAEPFLVELLAP